mmetsp:Transcript_7068/g.9760  ORF Transcript_7068/g.9760 Transcript_7068/m.9760 type:complete len:413 (+) Transcript_7068:121-1359(+)
MVEKRNGPRHRLSNFTTCDDVVKAIRKAKNVLVVTGAGISVSCGIPDFRSDVGLYNTLDCKKIGLPCAELLFDYEFFKIDPEPFYKFCGRLIPGNIKPSISHQFIAQLEKKKKLLRNYTQNVDGIEKTMGMTNVIECHGSMDTFFCIKCNRKKKLATIVGEVLQGEVCYCICGSALKPSITFFGECLASTVLKAMDKDIHSCDLVLVVGTSLKVGGAVHELLQRLDHKIPQVLINKEAVSLPAAISDGFDVTLLGNCDDIFAHIGSSLRWKFSTTSTSTTTKATTKKSSKSSNVTTTINKKRKINIDAIVNNDHEENAVDHNTDSVGIDKKQRVSDLSSKNQVIEVESLVPIVSPETVEISVMPPSNDKAMKALKSAERKKAAAAARKRMTKKAGRFKKGKDRVFTFTPFAY